MVAHHFIFNPVEIEKIKPPAGLVIAMGKWRQPGGSNLLLDRVEILHLDTHMIERLTLGISMRPGLRRRVEGEIMIGRSHVDDLTIVAGWSGPAHMPAENVLHQRSGPMGVAYSQVHMLDPQTSDHSNHLSDHSRRRLGESCNLN